MENCDILIIIPLQEELKVFKTSFQIIPIGKQNTIYYYSVITKNPGYKIYCLVLGETGPTNAATVTVTAISQCHPRLIILLGIGGALDKDLLLGDVVVAAEVDQFLADAKAVQEQEKYKLTFSGRHWNIPTIWTSFFTNFPYTSPSVFQLWQTDVNSYRASLSLKINQLKLIRDEPDLVLGQVASGDIVGASYSFAAELLGNNRKFKVLEMEAAGVASACERQQEVIHYLIIRGISDFSDERKSKLDKVKSGAFRRLAMKSATSLFSFLLQSSDFQTILPVVEKVLSSSPVPETFTIEKKKFVQVTLTYDGEPRGVTAINDQQALVITLSALLKIDSVDIRFHGLQAQRNTTSMEMRADAAYFFYEMASVHDSRILDLGIESLSVEGRGTIRITGNVNEANQSEQLDRLKKYSYSLDKFLSKPFSSNEIELSGEDVIQKWWKNRGFESNPFQWEDAGETPNDLVDRFFVDPLSERPLEDGDFRLLERIENQESKQLLIICGSKGSGKTFYCTLAVKQLENPNRDQYAIHIRNFKNANKDLSRINAADIAYIVYENVCQRFGVQPERGLGWNIETCMEKSTAVCQYNFKPYSTHPLVYILIDNINTLFDERNGNAAQNQTALKALIEFCQSVAQRCESNPFAFRIFTSLQLGEEIKRGLSLQYVGKVVVRELSWSKRSCMAVIEKRLETLYRNTSVRTPNCLMTLLTDETLNAVNDWLNTQSRISPRYVIHLFDLFTKFAFEKMPETELIPLETWRKFRFYFKNELICPPDVLLPFGDPWTDS